jgi:hypothetical protein
MLRNKGKKIQGLIKNRSDKPNFVNSTTSDQTVLNSIS